MGHVGRYLPLSVTLFLAGCATARTERVVHDFRERLLRAHTQQLLDNLIRIRNQLPTIHLAYSDLNVISKDTAKIAGSLGQGAVTGRTGTFGTGAAAAFVRNVTTSFSLSPEGSVEDSVSFHVDPVTDPKLYDAYILAARDCLGQSQREPAPSEVHMDLKQYSYGAWYFVKSGETARKQFLELSINAVTAAGASKGEGASSQKAARALERINIQEAFR